MHLAACRVSFTLRGAHGPARMTIRHSPARRSAARGWSDEAQPDQQRHGDRRFRAPVNQTGGSGPVVSTGVLHEQNGTFASATTSGLAAVFATTLAAQAAWDSPEVFPFM